jgi:hypothetical protein
MDRDDLVHILAEINRESEARIRFFRECVGFESHPIFDKVGAEEVGLERRAARKGDDRYVISTGDLDNLRDVFGRARVKDRSRQCCWQMIWIWLSEHLRRRCKDAHCQSEVPWAMRSFSAWDKQSSGNSCLISAKAVAKPASVGGW